MYQLFSGNLKKKQFAPFLDHFNFTLINLLAKNELALKYLKNFITAIVTVIYQ